MSPWPFHTPPKHLYLVSNWQVCVYLYSLPFYSSKYAQYHEIIKKFSLLWACFRLWTFLCDSPKWLFAIISQADNWNYSAIPFTNMKFGRNVLKNNLNTMGFSTIMKNNHIQDGSHFKMAALHSKDWKFFFQSKNMCQSNLVCNIWFQTLHNRVKKHRFV